MDAIVEERWREERRGRILAAAGRVFTKRSYPAASMDEIAAEAGLGKPTLYRYFRSKDTLFAAVFVQALDELERHLDEVLDARRNVRDELHGLVAAIAPMVRNHLAPMPGPTEGDVAADHSRRRIFRERRARIARYLSSTIERGVLTGELSAADPANVAQMMLGMIRSAAAATTLDDDEIARDVSALVFQGLARRVESADASRAAPGAPVRKANDMEARISA